MFSTKTGHELSFDFFFKHRKIVNFAEKSERHLMRSPKARDFSITYKLDASILRSLIGRVVSSALISRKKK